MAVAKWLKDKIGNIVIPKTKAECVFFDDGTNVNDAIGAIDNRFIELDEKKANSNNPTLLGTTKFRSSAANPYGIDIDEWAVIHSTPTESNKFNSFGVYSEGSRTGEKAQYTKDGISMSKYGKTTTVEASGIVSGGDVENANGVSLDGLNSNLSEYKDNGYLPKNLFNADNYGHYIYSVTIGSDLTQTSSDRYGVSSMLDGSKDITVSIVTGEVVALLWGIKNNKIAYYNDFASITSKTYKGGQYDYWVVGFGLKSLGTITSDIMKNNKCMVEYGSSATNYVPYFNSVSYINESLEDYGLVNVFDGNMIQGSYQTSDGLWSSNAYGICSANSYPCKAGNKITLKYAESVSNLSIRYYNGSSYISGENFTNVSEFTTTAPANTTNFKINIIKESDFTPNQACHIGVYVNNAIDEIKNDLAGKVSELRTQLASISDEVKLDTSEIISGDDGCSHNLLIPELQSVTKNGITATRNPDNSYTVNGTATEETEFELVTDFPNRVDKVTGTSGLYCNIVLNLNEMINGYVRYYNTYTEQTEVKYEHGNSFSLSPNDLFEKTNFGFIATEGTTYNNVIVKPGIYTFSYRGEGKDFDNWMPYVPSLYSIVKELREKGIIS